MKTRRFFDGVTLIELVIVLAISAVLIVIALSTSRTRSRSEFDNAMRQVVTDIRAVQTTAQAGSGPDESSHCEQHTEDWVTPDTSNNPTTCPAGKLFGKGVAFGTPASSPAPPAWAGSFGSITAKNGDQYGKSYLLDDLALSINPANYFRIRPYRPGAQVTHSIPSNIGFASSCFVSPSGVTYNCSQTKPLQIVFAKSGVDSGGSIIVGQSSVPLSMYVFNEVGFRPGSLSGSLLGSYNKTYQDEVLLYFKDTAGKFTATIHLIPIKNQINLCLDGSDCQ